MTVTGYDPRLRPAQPPTPAADAFAIHRAEVADGLELAYVREGVGGYPLAARARLSGDEADLVAQHRAARRRRVRGGRPRSPGPRRLGPLRRRHLRHRHLLP